MKKIFGWILGLFKQRTFRYYPAGFKVESTCTTDPIGCDCDYDFHGCEVHDGDMCSHDGIPYNRVNGKWVVDEELLAEVKRLGYYTPEELKAKAAAIMEKGGCCQ